MAAREYRQVSGERLELPEALDRASVLHNLEIYRAERTIRSFEVKGTPIGSEAETALLYILWAYSKPPKRSVEIRLIAPLGPRRGDVEPPLGQIILRYDADGHALARLVGRGRLKRGRGMASHRVTQSLMRNFALAGIDGHWRSEELHEVHLAFAKIPAEDRGALVGATLRRVRKIQDANHPAAAQYFYQQALQDTDVDDVVEFRVSDLAFASSGVSFVGDAGSVAPPSLQTILHEVGHAVETESERVARRRLCLAMAASNQRVGDWNRFSRLFARTHNALLDRERSWIDERNSRVNQHNRTLKQMRRAILGRPRLDLELDQARRRIALLDERIQALSHSRKALERLHDGISAFVQDAGERRQAEEALAEYRNRSDREVRLLDRTECLLASRVVDVRQDRVGKEQQLAAVYSNGRSHRLQNFINHVRRHRIEVGITAYARSSWPTVPGELFAEAYSLWLTDPGFLEETVPGLYRWFEHGRYRRDRLS